MEKLLKRSALVERQAKRKLVAYQGQRKSLLRSIQEQQEKVQTASIRKDTRAARLARREDWLLGPLATKRDAGDAMETYGTLPTNRIRGNDKVTWKDWGIYPGDRVVVVQEGHREQGKIGRVREVMEKAEECVVTGINKADFALEPYMVLKEADKSLVRTMEAALPFSAVRLVAALPHPETGLKRDVIINQIGFRSLNKAQLWGKERKVRVVEGLSPRTIIPYPKKKKEIFEDNPCDTLRIDVEDKTFAPTLRTPPFPTSIIDELRNKYSKFRTRHDDEYIEKKVREAAEAKAKRLEASGKMLTPLKELHMKQRAERRAKGKPVLSSDMLARIGEIMAKNREPPKAEHQTA